MRKIIPVILVFALVLIGLPDPAVAQTGCGTTFVVRFGDTLSEIAAICGVSYANLLAANPQITAPDWIWPGQVINIPQSGPGIPPTGGNPTTYTVVSGDTMFLIARRFNVTLAALSSANPQVTNINQIYPGQVLTIPGGNTGPGIPPTGGNPTYYTVRAGDTLFRIATANNTSVANLQTLNPWITNVNFILPGWVIRVT